MTSLLLPTYGYGSGTIGYRPPPNVCQGTYLHAVVDRLADEAVLQRIVAILGVLNYGVGEPVADGEALQVDLLPAASCCLVTVVLPESVADRRHVVPRVRLHAPINC